jgi:hypothetical protein
MRINSPINKRILYNTFSKMSTEMSIIETPVVSNTVAPVKRKIRTKEEIDKEKAEKEQKKTERQKKRQEKQEQKRLKTEQKTAKKKQHSSPLVPGTRISAQAAMCVIDLCKQNKEHTNIAFRRMFASRHIFPPKKNINKFATGGIAEVCVTQLFRDIGLKCKNVSEESTVIDLEIKVPIQMGGEPQLLQVSMKNSGKISSQPILENYRGKKREEIRPLPPTFIVYTETEAKRARIVYLDEEIIRQGYPGLSKEEFHAEIYTNNDSNLTFRSGFLAKFLPRLPTEYIVDAEYPENIAAGLSEQNLSKIALAEVVRQLDTNK